jgi:hypothetical protein
VEASLPEMFFAMLSLSNSPQRKRVRMVRRVYPIAGKHSETEEAILLYLYENPEGTHSTASLASGPEKDSLTVREMTDDMLEAVVEGRAVSTRRKPEDLQKDIESLIVKGLLRGRRRGTPGNITHADIELTPKGEREAIEAKNRLRSIVVTGICDPEDSPTQ